MTSQIDWLSVQPTHVTEAFDDRYLGPHSDLFHDLASTDVARIDAVHEALVRLQNQFVGLFAREQKIRSLIQGFIAYTSFLAGESTRDHKSSQPEVLHRQNCISYLEAIATHFDECWMRSGENCPEVNLSVTDLINDCQELEQFLSTRKNTFGTWIAVDSYLTHQGVTLNTRSAETPIVFIQKGGFNNKEEGLVGKLAVTQLPYGNDLFYPDALAVGLATIDYGDEGFLSAAERVWNAAGLVSRGRGFKWKIRRFSKDTSKLCTTMFKDRSCEAAFACALWSAAGVAPDGNGGLIENTEDELDEKAVVTAMLDEKKLDGPGTPLGGVKGLQKKVEAAQAAGIDLIVVAEEQSEIDDIKKLQAEFGIQIVPVATLGQAFEELISSNRIMRAYRLAIEDAWLNQWETDPETGLSTGAWSGAIHETSPSESDD